MEKLQTGLYIRQKRMEHSWSLDGLCKGVCSVSYLSKIEQGKADASPEVLHLLLEKLGVQWHDGEEDRAAAHALAEKMYEAVFSMSPAKVTDSLVHELRTGWDKYSNGPHFVDFELLRDAAEAGYHFSLPEGCELYLNARQRALWHLAREEWIEAVRLSPCPITCYYAGSWYYTHGNYALALEHLQQSCRMAAEEGMACVMMYSHATMGNCYSCTGDVPQMKQHYTVARRLAEALDDQGLVYALDYNLAATALDVGETEESYAYFSAPKEPDVLSLHKLAVCCERLGKRNEAIAALNKADSCAKDDLPCHKKTILWMLAVVRFRLEDPDYLQKEAYGKLLLEGFEALQKAEPVGYVLFHLPAVLEWHTAHRQYKQAFELLRDFPAIHSLVNLKV